MKNNLSKFLFGLCMLFMLMPVFGVEEVSATPIIGNVDTTGTTSGEGWTYDAATNTLTLNNYNGNATSIVDMTSETLTICLVGNNAITITENIDNTPAIMCNNLVFTGDGSLTINAAYGGISSHNGKVTMSGVNLTVSATNYAVNVDSLQVSGGMLTAVSDGAPITVNNELLIDGGTVIATVQNPVEIDYTAPRAIYVGNVFTLTSGTVSATGGHGIQGGQSIVTISGGTLEATALTNNALDVGTLNITGGTTKLIGKNYGIITAGQLTISGGVVDIETTGEYGCGISPFGGYSIDNNNATVTIKDSTSSGGSNTGSTSGNVATGIVNGQHVAFEVMGTPSGFDSTEQESAWNNLMSTLETSWNSMGDINWGETEEDVAVVNTQVYAPIIRQLVGMDVSKVYFANLIHIENTENVDMSAGVPITFAAGGINEGDSVLVLHLKSDGTWEVVPATAGNGTITATFTSLSPVYYFRLGNEQHQCYFTDTVIAPTETTWGYTAHVCNECGYRYEDNHVAPLGETVATAAETGATGAYFVSPKTGEDNGAMIMALFAVIAMSGMFICTRKAYK